LSMLLPMPYNIIESFWYAVMAASLSGN